MKCFYSGADAVGLCKACGRGISLAHLTELPRGLACKERCEKKVEELVLTEDESIKIYSDGSVRKLSAGNSNRFFAFGIFYVLIGGYFVWESWGGQISLPMGIGALIAAYGLYHLVQGWKARSRSK